MHDNPLIPTNVSTQTSTSYSYSFLHSLRQEYFNCYINLPQGCTTDVFGGSPCCRLIRSTKFVSVRVDWLPVSVVTVSSVNDAGVRSSCAGSICVVRSAGHSIPPSFLSSFRRPTYPRLPHCTLATHSEQTLMILVRTHLQSYPSRSHAHTKHEQSRSSGKLCQLSIGFLYHSWTK